MNDGAGRDRPLRRGLAATLTTLAITAATTVPTAATATPAFPPVPAAAPPAARGAPLTLPRPEGWPFEEAFPGTSGTGREHGGAWFWTDFLHDDRGAIGVGSLLGESAGAPPWGSYRYPDAAAHGNGADLFRLGVGLTPDATIWRADLLTLEDPDVPVVAFALDRDGDGGPPVTIPGGTGVHAPGIDAALVVSGRGAWWHDLARGVVVDVVAAGGRHIRDGRSLVVHLPRSLHDPVGRSRVTVVSGLADDDGDGFRRLGPTHGATPAGPHVYDVAPVAHTQEPQFANFWSDRAQAAALTLRDVGRFGAELDWTRLADRATTPEPRPTGWTSRWYVSSVAPGAGRTTSIASTTSPEPAYLGDVLPYGVHVPQAYDPATPTPLTWLLHSLAINHQQYAATTPSLLDGACEQLDTICVTPTGRGPAGMYRDLAELDLWEVWRDLAAAFHLDAERTVLGGYSMGGFGTARLGADHPDLFAGLVLLATRAGADLPRLGNVAELPTYVAHGALDQLVPYPDASATVDALREAGARVVFDTYPTKDHVVWSLEDGFDEAVRWLASQDRRRPAPPARFTYRWRPGDLDPDLGLGPDGAWWVTAVRGEGEVASVAASSDALPDRPVTLVQERELRGSPLAPVWRTTQRWEDRVEVPRSAARVTVTTAGTTAATLQATEAGLTSSGPSTVIVEGDRSWVLTVTQLTPGTQVRSGGRVLATAGGDGRVEVSLDPGRVELTLARGRA